MHLGRNTCSLICTGFWIQLLSPFNVCCCKLNNTRVCDEHLFRQVGTSTSHNQLPIFHCTNVHLGRHTCSLIYTPSKMTSWVRVSSQQCLIARAVLVSPPCLPQNCKMCLVGIWIPDVCNIQMFKSFLIAKWSAILIPFEYWTFEFWTSRSLFIRGSFFRSPLYLISV